MRAGSLRVQGVLGAWPLTQVRAPRLMAACRLPVQSWVMAPPPLTLKAASLSTHWPRAGNSGAHSSTGQTAECSFILRLQPTSCHGADIYTEWITANGIERETKHAQYLSLHSKVCAICAGASFRTYGSAESGRSNGDFSEEPAALGLPGPYQIPPEAAPLPSWPLQHALTAPAVQTPKAGRAAESLEPPLLPPVPVQVCFLMLSQWLGPMLMSKALHRSTNQHSARNVKEHLYARHGSIWKAGICRVCQSIQGGTAPQKYQSDLILHAG